MTNILNDQETLIYVMDADTKQIIRKNFKCNGFESPMDPGNFYYELITGGTKFSRISGNPYGSGGMSFAFDENQITEFGYDYKSITGNYITGNYDSELEAYLCPSVAIIYMSKLK